MLAPLVEVLRRPVEPAQYLALRYTQRLADAGVVASVGSTGDSYDTQSMLTAVGVAATV